MFLFATSLIIPSYGDFEFLGVKQLDHKPNNSPSSCVKTTNVWSFTSLPHTS